MPAKLLTLLRSLLLLLLAALALWQVLQGAWRIDNTDDGQQRHRQQGTGQSGEEQGPLLCFVIRTYWGHGQHDGNPLGRMLQGLVSGPHKR